MTSGLEFGVAASRLVWIRRLFLLFGVAILARTLWLQLGGPDRWSKRAHQQQTANLAEPPQRGRILDREGRVLVDHIPRFHLHWESSSEPPAQLDALLRPASRKLLRDGLAVAVEESELPAVSE